MNQDIIGGLRRQRRMLEARIKGCHYSFPIFEASRLNIRNCLPIEHIPTFWNSSREVLNSQTRTLMSLIPECYQTQIELDKLDKIHPDAD